MSENYYQKQNKYCDKIALHHESPLCECEGEMLFVTPVDKTLVDMQIIANSKIRNVIAETLKTQTQNPLSETDAQKLAQNIENAILETLKEPL